MKQALEVALEALESSDKLINGTESKYGLEGVMDGYYSGCFDVDGNNKLLKEAITAIKEALAQPEQEPVAFPRNVQEYDEDWIIDPAFISRVKHSIDPETPYEFTPSEEQIETTLLALEVIPASLYTTSPQTKKPEQEPVAWVNWCAATGKRSVSFECESELASQPLYTKEQS